MVAVLGLNCHGLAYRGLGQKFGDITSERALASTISRADTFPLSALCMLQSCTVVSAPALADLCLTNAA